LGSLGIHGLDWFTCLCKLGPAADTQPHPLNPLHTHSTQTRTHPSTRSLPGYDIAGDGIATRDFVTVAANASALDFCKSQCGAIPECEFVVSQDSKCYLKNNIGGGTYGTTGASSLTEASCVKGADNWLRFALQVSNQPAGGVPPPVAAPGAVGAAAGAGAAVGSGELGGLVPTTVSVRRNMSRMNGAGGSGRQQGVGGLAMAAALGAVLLLLRVG